jgi:hypothetical protein
MSTRRTILRLMMIIFWFGLLLSTMKVVTTGPVQGITMTWGRAEFASMYDAATKLYTFGFTVKDEEIRYGK